MRDSLVQKMAKPRASSPHNKGIFVLTNISSIKEYGKLAELEMRLSRTDHATTDVHLISSIIIRDLAVALHLAMQDGQIDPDLLIGLPGAWRYKPRQLSRSCQQTRRNSRPQRSRR